MRIANNLFPSVRALIVGTATFVFVLSAAELSHLPCAFAADPMPGVPGAQAAPVAPAATPGAQAQIQAPAAAPNLIDPSAIASPPSPMALNAPAPGADMTKNITAMENKISDNAKAVVKTLDSSGDALTLEDLNSAKQTVARIDAIIDVEKRLGELEKLRNERTGAKNSSSLASSIPASALQPLPAAIRPMEMPVEREIPYKPPAPTVEISRIVGSEGVYSAVLKVNGELKTVHVGDQYSGKATVKSISPSSVTVEDNGEYRTMHLKNVDAIFSAMR